MGVLKVTAIGGYILSFIIVCVGRSFWSFAWVPSPAVLPALSTIHERCGNAGKRFPHKIPLDLTPSEDESTRTEGNSISEESELLLAKARRLREEIARKVIKEGDTKKSKSTSSRIAVESKWVVPSVSSIDGVRNSEEGVGYRLYVDIGREPGTWMDPRWGASGKRIEFSLDVKFLVHSEADDTSKELMVKDNFGGKSSPVFSLQSAKFARLRSGFDSMKCNNGAYRIDAAGNNGYTIRFFVPVRGTNENDSSYGDVSIPKGCLYFSLPCFGGRISSLSIKEGPVTVRQMGWNTGWRREESRIVGVFRAKPIKDALSRDGY